MKPDMFKPYILLDKCAGAGIITIIGGHCSNMKFTVNGGSPYQSAYNEAFELAVTLRVPLWLGNQFSDQVCAYSPEIESLDKESK